MEPGASFFRAPSAAHAVWITEMGAAEATIVEDGHGRHPRSILLGGNHSDAVLPGVKAYAERLVARGKPKNVGLPHL